MHHPLKAHDDLISNYGLGFCIDIKKYWIRNETKIKSQKMKENSCNHHLRDAELERTVEASFNDLKYIYIYIHTFFEMEWFEIVHKTAIHIKIEVKGLTIFHFLQYWWEPHKNMQQKEGTSENQAL